MAEQLTFDGNNFVVEAEHKADNSGYVVVLKYKDLDDDKLKVYKGGIIKFERNMTLNELKNFLSGMEKQGIYKLTPQQILKEFLVKQKTPFEIHIKLDATVTLTNTTKDIILTSETVEKEGRTTYSIKAGKNTIEGISQNVYFVLLSKIVQAFHAKLKETIMLRRPGVKDRESVSKRR